MEIKKKIFSYIVDINNFIEEIADKCVPYRELLGFIISSLTITLSLMLSLFLRANFSFPLEDSQNLPHVLAFALVIKLSVFYLMGLYKGMWRFVSVIDMVAIFLANIIASVILLLCVIMWHETFFLGFPRSAIVIDCLLCFMIMTGKRVAMRIIRESAAKAAVGKVKSRTLIVGKPDMINALLQSLSSAPTAREVIGVISDDSDIGQTIRGVRVLGHFKSTAKCAKKYLISEIMLLPPYSGPSTIKELMEELEKREVACELRMVPSYADIADGNITISHIKEVEIEDLLGRKPVRLDRKDVREFVRGKNILITGAGGSIGSELCRQLASYNPAKMVLFDLSEYNLYTISMELSGKSEYPDIISIIGDVREYDDIANVLLKYKIDVVYHAAAYKHVPLMEENPFMAIKTNVFGTLNVIDACEKSGVKRMILISTDKAVCPTSIMGASKRIAERCVLEREKSDTEFVVVRFGNVLGSSGSVIPLFKQQIKEGGPITVTSKNVVRYFMSIPEAVDLLLQAGVIGKDRDIMVLEMGEQIKIYDMARKLIELSGLTPDKDIRIEIIGLRPGEKEYEELLTDNEKVETTSYEKIFVARKNYTEAPEIEIERIRECVKKNSEQELRKLLAKYIPENKFAFENK